MAAKILNIFVLLAIFAISQQASIHASKHKLRITQTTIYVGTKVGLAISNDDGISWNKIPDFKDIPVNAISADVNGSIYIGASNGLSKTDDDVHWDNITERATTKNVRSFYIAPTGNGTYVGTDYYQGNLRYTHDNGQIWGQKVVGKKSSSVVGLGESRGTIFALTQDAGLYQSFNEGDSWKLLAYPTTSPPSVTIGLSLFVSNGRIYLGTDNGLFISDDQGVTLKKITSFPESYAYVNAIFVKQIEDAQNETIYVGTYSGLSFSTNYGQTWKSYKDTLQYSVSSIFVADDGTMYVGTYGNGLYVSSDGVIWQTITKDHGLPDNGVTAVYAEDRKVSED